MKNRNCSKDVLAEITDVYKSFHRSKHRISALHKLSLEIMPNEFLVIVGPSGSGKTTLLNLLAGLDTPTKGKVCVLKENLGRLSDQKRTRFRLKNIGFVFQFFNLLPTLTALENVSLPLELTRAPIHESREKSRKIMGDVGLNRRLNSFPDQLSGGEQQRVAIARSLITDAPLILCDEPTGNLDFKSGREILGIMRDLNRKKKKTFVIVTHNTAIQAIADRVIHIRDGSVLKVTQNKKPKDPRKIVW